MAEYRPGAGGRPRRAGDYTQVVTELDTQVVTELDTQVVIELDTQVDDRAGRERRSSGARPALIELGRGQQPADRRLVRALGHDHRGAHDGRARRGDQRRQRPGLSARWPPSRPPPGRGRPGAIRPCRTPRCC